MEIGFRYWKKVSRSGRRLQEVGKGTIKGRRLQKVEGGFRN